MGTRLSFGCITKELGMWYIAVTGERQTHTSGRQEEYIQHDSLHKFNWHAIMSELWSPFEDTHY